MDIGLPFCTSRGRSAGNSWENFDTLWANQAKSPSRPFPATVGPCTSRGGDLYNSLRSVQVGEAICTTRPRMERRLGLRGPFLPESPALLMKRISRNELYRDAEETCELAHGGIRNRPGILFPTRRPRRNAGRRGSHRDQGRESLVLPTQSVRHRGVSSPFVVRGKEAIPVGFGPGLPRLGLSSIP